MYNLPYQYRSYLVDQRSRPYKVDQGPFYLANPGTEGKEKEYIELLRQNVKLKKLLGQRVQSPYYQEKTPVYVQQRAYPEPRQQPIEQFNNELDYSTANACQHSRSLAVQNQNLEAKIKATKYSHDMQHATFSMHRPYLVSQERLREMKFLSKFVPYLNDW